MNNRMLTWETVASKPLSKTTKSSLCSIRDAEVCWVEHSLCKDQGLSAGQTHTFFQVERTHPFHPTLLEIALTVPHVSPMQALNRACLQTKSGLAIIHCVPFQCFTSCRYHYLKQHHQKKILQWVKHLRCSWLSQVESSASYMVP